jgi:hypothetical protein
MPRGIREVGSIATLICCWLAACRAEPLQNTTAPEQPEPTPPPQEIVLTAHPFHHQTPSELDWAWQKVSRRGKQYRLARREDFKLPGLRSFQYRVLGELFMIVIDQTGKDPSRYKILVLHASDKAEQDYRPYWVACDHDLSRTSLYNSNIGVVAVGTLKQADTRSLF